MYPGPHTRPLWAALLVFVLLLSACGGGKKTQPSQASASNIAVIGDQQGATPFIRFVQLRGDNLALLTAVHYAIAPKPGSVSKPVDVSFDAGALIRRGNLVAASGTLNLPVFGLYSGYANHLAMDFRFQDGSTRSLPLDITTAAYADPNGIYDHPTIVKARAAGSELGFDFFAIKSGYGTPVVIDTDGEIRWVGTGVANSGSAAFRDNGFVVGDPNSLKLTRLELDGTTIENSLVSSTYTTFHHNIDPGKLGLLAELNAVTGGVANIESTLVEIADSGTIIKDWNLAALLASYMQSQGDDPGTFVRPGADWFHMNAATYDPRDDSLIVSSRENFVIKIDYMTGEIIWILGDPTKYWYSFPSLRAKALNLQAGGLYPIGQHGVSITSDGLLMLFNNGAASFNQPAGAPAGEPRAYSAVVAYAIDPVSRSAQEVWRFDYGQSISSLICSSAYEAPGKSLLVDYAYTVNGTQARLVGLDASHAVVFDFQYPSPTMCGSAWNSLPVPFDSMWFH